MKKLPLRSLIPNLFTFISLTFGLTAIKFAIEQKWQISVSLIVFASFLDNIDGKLARLLKTNSDFGVIFLNRGENLPRHPAQLYEAFGYLILFALLVLIYNKTKLSTKKGFIFGFFLTKLFSIRFIVEYVKESQGGIEETLGILSTGQWLSIPFIIFGFLLMINSYKIKAY